MTTADLDRASFERLLTEAAAPGPPGCSRLDSQIGFAIRRWCPPVLGLPRHATAEHYLTRRRELGGAAVTRRFLRQANLAGLCLDTGYAPPGSLGLTGMAAAAGVPTFEVVRLESVAEECAGRQGSGAAVSATDFADRVRCRLAERCASRGDGDGDGAVTVAVKTIVGYRVGLGLAGERPSDREVAAAAGHWLSEIDCGAPVRLADAVLHRFLIWAGVDLGLPIQVHVGLGDVDLNLHHADPLLLTELLRATAATGVPVVLLHNYPYHRHAGYLSQVFDHVFVDVGLALHNVGNEAATVLRETLELAPFGKVLYSSDACGLPELYFLGARLFRRALSQVLTSGIGEDAWGSDDARRVASLIAEENAQRLYLKRG